MTVETLEAPYLEHRDTVLGVLARRCGWLDEDDREAIFHDAYALMLEKERDGGLETEAMHPKQVRAYLIQTAINKALDEGKRAHRKRSEPLGDAALEVADGGPAPDDTAAASFDGARVQEIVAELPARRQAVVKLRFFFEHSPEEIQRTLGISSRSYRRDLERALRYVSERYELVRDGTFCDSRRSLILDYLTGDSEPERQVEARRHLSNCPACARWAIEVRGAARHMGAVAPVFPLLLDNGFKARTAELAGSLRDTLGDLLALGKQLAIATATRLDPGLSASVAGARPGMIAATVASCVAVGSGATYCAVEGVPGTVRSLFSEERRESANENKEPPPQEQPKPTQPQQAAEPPAPAQPHDPEPPDRPEPSPPPAPPQQPPPASPPPPVAAETEFGFERPGSGGGGSGSGEFGP